MKTPKIGKKESELRNTRVQNHKVDVTVITHNNRTVQCQTMK
jgi:hypothetical protein